MERRRKRLKRLVATSERVILNFLQDKNQVERNQVEPYVLNHINVVWKKDGSVRHVTKPIHRLAFIMAYKNLENRGEIAIFRGDVPYPMTDSKSSLSLMRRYCNGS